MGQPGIVFIRPNSRLSQADNARPALNAHARIRKTGFKT